MSAYAIAGLQSGTILTIADIATQLGIDGRKLKQQGEFSSASTGTAKPRESETYDPCRTLRWTGAGLLIHGPYFKFTFAKIDGFFANYPLNLRTVLLKTATAQFTSFPGYLALLFTYMGLAEGIQSTEELSAKVFKKVPEAFAAGCVFWPIANTINFTFVSPAYRVPYLASCGSIWGCVLSCLNARGAQAASVAS